MEGQNEVNRRKKDELNSVESINKWFKWNNKQQLTESRREKGEVLLGWPARERDTKREEGQKGS